MILRRTATVLAHAKRPRLGSIRGPTAARKLVNLKAENRNTEPEHYHDPVVIAALLGWK